MKKKNGKIRKRVVSLAVVCALSTQLFGITAFAAQTNWALYHTPNGSSGTNILSWSKTVTATLATTSVHISEITGNPTIQAVTSNGINRSFIANGVKTATASAKVGDPIKLEVYYTAYGSGYSSAKGYFLY